MRTNIELDEKLINQALELSHLKSKKDVVHEALRQYVAAVKRKKILFFRGKDTWGGDLDQMRSIQYSSKKRQH